MAPFKETRSQNLKDGSTSLSGEEVVISGISGVFPNSVSVVDFMDNLYNKVDMVSDEPKWNVNNPDIPKHVGKIKEANKFDAQFFGVSFQLARVLEPMGRMLMEQTFGALIDSGTNLKSLRGKKIGVFVGAYISDSSALHLFRTNLQSDSIINGGSKAMLANRISFWIDAKGPSYGLDYAESSSSACLEIAYNSIKSGECDAAIVGGCNYVLFPNVTWNLRRAGLLCLDGKTKCFDKNADGYVRADAINSFFLQKSKDAHRIYAELYHVKGKYNLKPDALFLPLRETEDIEKFLKEFYSETDVDPESIEYVEAHGAAIAKADANELNAIANVFAKNAPIKVGSVKSNMGNSEAASGSCAVTKLCLAYHKGKLPANLHYNEPQDHIPAIRDGKVQVVTDQADFNRGFTAMNNFSFTGSNFHVVLKGHYKEKNLEKYFSNIPRIILASGRQESSVKKIVDMIKSHPIDPEEIGLIHQVFEHDISGHTGRGYTILGTNENQETISMTECIDYYPGGKRPLWFVYSGMGSQWPGMGADLMRIPTFAAAIHKCHNVLEPKGVDLLKIVTDPDSNVTSNILHAFIGIGAMQIALTDVIKEMGIVPDYVIGHSLGETGCAYQDDTLTAEEVILSTYNRGKVCYDTELIKGSMAAVGLGYKAIVHQCPPEIDVACHNSSESTTISGPTDKLKEFVGKLTQRGIFAKEVPCANIAFHSRYIGECGPLLLQRLRQVIKNPKKRSSKWLSTSVPQSKWDEPRAIYSSADYHVNNLLSPVLFEEITKMIPANAVVVEIAPHGLLQAILKRSHPECTHIPITRRGATDSVKFLLEAVGKLYLEGVNPKVDVLYPKIEYPVSTETPLLSHIVEWEHSEDWPVHNISENDIITSSARNYIISIHDDEYNFLEGHIKNGVNVLPESAIIVLVWETLAMYMGTNYKEQSVIFKDIQFHSEVTIKRDVPLKLTIAINRGTNNFEVSQDDKRVASGFVDGVKIIKILQHAADKSKTDDEEIILDTNDIYNILKSRGYSYRNSFQSIQSTNLDYNEAYVQWDNNWVTLLDSLIQFNILSRNCKGISTLKFIRKLRISILDQNICKTVNNNGVECLAAQYNEIQGVIRCAGVELDNITFEDKPLLEPQLDILVNKAFYPHYGMDKVDLKTALRIIFQIVAENTTMKKIRSTQIITSNKNINCIINEISNYIPNITINFNMASVTNLNYDLNTLLVQNTANDEANIFIIENLLGDQKKLESLQNLSKDIFILAIESGVPKLQGLIKENFIVMSSMSDGKQILVLLKRQDFKDVSYVPVNCDNKLDWVTRVYDELNKTKRVVLVSERQPYCSALGFVQNLRNNGVDKVGLVVIDDFHAPSFNPRSAIYKDQLDKNMAINVLRKGQWGGFYYLPSTKSTNLRNVILTSTASDLDSLTWIEAPPITPSHNLVQVSYAGISLRDTEKAVTNKHGEEFYGMDFSGIDADGDRVMGLVAGGALSSTVEADSALLWPVPSHWSLQDAATVPLPYALAYYCLSNLKKGQSVFVTGGAGAFGQAVIALSLSVDCEVYTSVSNVLKKELLLRLFPMLKEINICQSRNDSFLNLIKTSTRGIGCDYVINCASGYLRETAMKCTRDQGYFLDLSICDMKKNENMGMAFIAGDRSYKAINISNIFRPEFTADKKVLQQLIAEGISKGIVRPISRVEYSPVEISRAFRLLSSSKHIGKVLIRMSSPEILKQGFDVVPRMYYSPIGVYVVICDENGLGIELADRLVDRGARKMVLHSKSKVSGYWQTKFASWKKYVVSIKISTENLQTQQGCTKLLKEAAKIGCIKGIFIVQDIADKNEQNAQDFVGEFNKTVLTVINLDLTSKTYCNELSHFVLIKPTSQSTSSEFAFSVSEKICQARLECGFPALVLRTNALTELPQTLLALFNAMEHSLKLKLNNVLYYNSNTVPDSDYLTKLVKIFGVANIENLQNEAIVSDLKLNEVNLIEIQNLIKKAYQIDYPLDKIQRMDIESLKNIGNTIGENPKDQEGLGTFYRHVDVENVHIDLSHPIVPMITLLNNGIENGLDPNETYLTMIPGFEGRHHIFNMAAERLKVQAVAVRMASDIEGSNIPEIAATIRKFMKTKFETKSKFYLLGYSFGVNVALELAALLEKEGHIGVVYCLDSSPDALKIQLNSHLGNLTDSELQNVVLQHLYKLMSGEDSGELSQYLEQTKDWSDKIDACMYKLRGLPGFSNQYKWSILQSAYSRILMAQEYEPDFKLNSELVLIKGIPHPNSENLPEDYNLSKYTSQPVKVFQIESDHATAPYDCRVPNIVNKMLDSTLLKKFQTTNLCDKYAYQNVCL